MALVLNDRVKETSTTQGTGDITLAGAVNGFQTFQAKGPIEAIELCEQRTYDLITLDYSMPVHTGIELYEILKSKDLTGSSVVVMISGESRDSTIMFCKKNGIFLFMKPINEAGFKGAVSEMLEYQ